MTDPTPEQYDGSYFDSLVPRVTCADLEREMSKIVVPRKDGNLRMTPEQMRALADALDAGVFRNEGLWPDEAQDVENSIVALRAAADQLEAVSALERIYVDAWGSYAVSADALDVSLTSDTAPPQEESE